MVKKYGVEWAMQSPTLLDKNRHGAFKTETVVIEGREFRCQGYEAKFLRNCSRFGLAIDDLTDDVPSIPYIDIGAKRRRYVPDFLCISSGMVVEVKSTWTYDGCGKRSELRENNRAKMKGVLESGRTFTMYVFDGRLTLMRTLERLEDFDE